ncbi:TMAO reductase system periplasmic protein TorT [Paracoccus laeviglucosivorans]|uniref:Monosaccharide ABC transporter substrate-binding protein, CUT2 family n=1 Tax=Paracoccus laeviglucosivorans TaxID=1197861 RepID=A0A521FE37_9RHOB|nr:TMAO reductase system periplasmic protein TorT [Paracoccus laeviglucosivorans]SMO94468.1 monosaccharide ABC transporter substrate-binding protein, CUT2 family [Paracoccus laeviglucosivorans]
MPGRADQGYIETQAFVTDMRHFLELIGAGLFLIAMALPSQADTWSLQVFDQPFHDEGRSRHLDYQPLEQATRGWRLCVLYPHLKDAYWLSVNYGMVEEARRLGVGFDLFEAGGYPNLERQIAQLRECADQRYDAVVIGTVSYAGLTPVLTEIARAKPVIAVVNDIDPSPLTAKASVPWTEMGRAAGRELARLHPKGTPTVDIAWFPGPHGAGWVTFVDAGFRQALEESSARIVRVMYGDTGREAQAQLVEQLLSDGQHLDYLVGSGPMAEVAISILRNQAATEKTGIISTYMSHGVYRGIRRGRIVSAPADAPVIQGKLGIEMSIRTLEGKLSIIHAGPAINIITSDNADRFDRSANLAPASFLPTFSVHATSR